MLRWLRDKFQKSKKSNNPDQLSAADLELLRQDLKPLEEIQSGLSERCLTFLVDGGQAPIEAQQLPGVKLRLQVSVFQSWGRENGCARDRLFASSSASKVEFLARLADLYTKAAGPLARFQSNLLKREAPWLEVLIREIFPPCAEVTPVITFETLEAICSIQNTRPELLLSALLEPQGLVPTKQLLEMPGLFQAFDRYPLVVEKALSTADPVHTVSVLKNLRKYNLPLQGHRELLLSLALGSSKQVRQASAAIVEEQVNESWQGLLRRACESGKTAQRVEAINLLNSIAGSEVRDFFRELGASEQPEAVAQLLSEIVEAPEVQELPAPGPQPEVDTRKPSLDLVPVLEAFIDAYRDHWKAASKAMTEVDLDWLRKEINDRKAGEEPMPKLNLSYKPKVRAKLNEILVHPSLTLLQALRLCLLSGSLHYEASSSWWRPGHRLADDLELYRQGRRSGPSLKEISAALQHMGYGKELLNGAASFVWSDRGWSTEEIWPYYGDVLSQLKTEIRTGTDFAREVALEKILTFPVPPPQLVELLWEVSLGSVASERKLAQRALQNLPGFEKRVLKALGHGRQEVRALASDWLASTNCEAAVNGLQMALEKEKSELAKASMLTALDKLGADTDLYFSPELLLTEANKGLKKGAPKALEWFPFSKLPAVRWSSGELVELNILTWLVVRAFKVKASTPGPLLRRYASLLNQGDGAELGLFVLGQFLNEQRQEDGQATRAKGILNITGACGDGRVTPLIESFIKKWYGQRLHQCKALLGVLASIEDPACLQLLLSVANRFRTKGLQKEAEKLVAEVAQSKGWSTDELADRTVPTAGFDENRKMILDYGSRSFEVELGRRLHPFVRAEDGSSLKNLPKPGKKDDPELAPAAEKRFKASKKELKSVLKLQLERLSEAMACQREWSFLDWKTYVYHHPILGALSQRLLWHCQDTQVTFRPMEDGSLSDNQDEEVVLEDAHRVTVGHPYYLSEDDKSAWLQHFHDYEVLPVLGQLERESWSLPEEMRRTTEFSEFQGYIVTSFVLRDRLSKKSGFLKGESRESGWITNYRKKFSALDLEAVVHFSGCMIAGDNDDVALGALTFERRRKKIVLGDVPPVLLAECRYALKLAAEAGSGFSSQWERFF